MGDVWVIHPAGAWGGAEKTTLVVLESLKSIDLEPILVTNYPRFIEEVEELNVEVLLLPLQSWFESFSEVIKDILLLSRQLKRDGDVKLLVGIMPYGAFLATFLSKLFCDKNIKSVVSPRGSCRYYLKYFVDNSWLRRVYKFLFFVAFGLADFFFSPSKLSTLDYVNFFGVKEQKCFLIPNGIHLFPGSFSDLLSRRKDFFSTPRLIWVGRLSKEKNLNFLLRAFSFMKSKAFFYLVGDGPEYKWVEKRIKDLGLDKSAFLLGHYKDIAPLLSNSHVFVHSCLFEEFGYTIIEAMNLGLPVVACDCPYGPREILDYGRFGFLVSDTLDMAYVLDELLTYQDLWIEFSERSFKRSRCYDIEKVLELYQLMFRDIING